MIISGAAKLAGVIGWPITHSRSPAIHGFWLEQYGIDGAYIPLGIDPKNIGQMFDALPKLGFRGWNVTLPHKEDAFRLVHERTQTAEDIGAVNTVTVQPDGSLHGNNSDAFGFMAHLDQSAPGWPKDRPAVVLGAGGAARAVCSGLLQAGVPSLRLMNRTKTRAEALAAGFGPQVEVIDWEERSEALEGAGLLTNTTSLGMTKQPALEIALDDMPGDGVVYDIVYVPLETDLLARARARNLACVDGLGMLLHQARPGFHRWFGVDAQVTVDLHQSVVRTLRA